MGLGTSIARAKNALGKSLLLWVALGLPAWVHLAGLQAAGQTSGSVDTKAQPHAPVRRRTITIDDQVKRFAELLDLSEAQQSKVKKALEFQQVQIRRIRLDGSVSGAEKINRLRGLQGQYGCVDQGGFERRAEKEVRPACGAAGSEEFPPAQCRRLDEGCCETKVRTKLGKQDPG